MSTTPSALRKVKDVVIYRDDWFHSAFPSVVRRPDGEMLVAFRRAPSRLKFGEGHNDHVDPNSYLVTVRSRDGETWTAEPALLHAHAFGGLQDPCMLQLRDGTLLCMTYGWSFLRPDGLAKLKQPVGMHPIQGAVFNGGWYLRSTDGGKSWQGPWQPPPLKDDVRYDPFGQRIRPSTRGAPIEGRDGRIHWAVVGRARVESPKSSVYLLVSEDKGVTWNESCLIAADDKVTFNETSLIETPKGDLVAFLRTADFDDQACIARSTDGGKSFQPWEGMGWQGHPLHALALPDNRVLLVYGYRHQPYGIRARVLNAECTDFATAPEMVLRDDGTTTDLGYPWSAMLDEKRVLVTYYFNVDGGIQHIAGTILEIE